MTFTKRRVAWSIGLLVGISIILPAFQSAEPRGFMFRHQDQLAVATVAVSALPLIIPRRFSIREMLIFTTLVAIVLVLVIYAVK